MTMRTLTLKEMKAQKQGDVAFLVGRRYGLPHGTPLKRRISVLDGGESYGYSYSDNGAGWNFFKEGEVAVAELVAPGELTLPFSVDQVVCAGRTCIDIETDKTTEELTEELGIFRPELETRKVGKIRVELVDHGFPLALREVAKVMTWAQTAKGYKDHDWQNLPNAEVALEAAASRHRTDHIEQRVVEGYLIERCVDHESGLLHKAHEAFGVLAQLELMLRGEFDIGVDTPH